MTKQSFYQNFREQEIAMYTDKLYNDYIGGNECSMQDGQDYTAFTEEQLIETISNDIVSTKDAYVWLDNGMALEKKHIKFVGNQRIHEIVEHRIQYRHKKEGLWMWEESKVNA